MESTALASKALTVEQSASPFEAAAPVDMTFIEGMTLAEILDAAQPDPILRAHCSVFIHDYYIAPENYRRVRPKHGAIISLRVIPQGGGGKKNPLRTILTLAVIAASFAFGGPLASAMFNTTMVGGVATVTLGAGITVSASALGGAIISAVGTLLVNAIAPIRPQKMKGPAASVAESPTLSISGTQNQPRPFGTVPVVFGRHKMTPPLGALPYTEIVGNDQFLRMVFVWGFGPLLIEDLRIGDTPISEYSDIEIVTRAGYAHDGPLTLYTKDVNEENIGSDVTEETGWITRVSGPEADELSIDLVFARGLVKYNSRGDKTKTSVQFAVEWAAVGSDDFVGAGAPFADRQSADLDVEPLTQGGSAYGSTSPRLNPKRLDAVVIDRMSGAISVIKGTPVEDSRQYVRNQGYVLVPGVPALPSVPETKVLLASVLRTDTNNVLDADITDLRSATAPFGDPVNDFVVTETDTPSKKVKVSSGTLMSAAITVEEATSEAKRYPLRIAVPERGQYKVRVKRITADSTDSSTFDVLSWAILRTITNRMPMDPTGLATTEIRIKATDQLNQIIDQFNGVATSILPDWDADEEDWVLRATRNPSSIGRAVLQGPGNARPLADARIHLSRWEYFHEYCTNNGLTFNMVRDFSSNVWDTLSDIMSAAFASPTQIDGKWSVVIDEPKTVPAQHFTPRNSFGFSFERTYPERPHGWRIRFLNEQNFFKQDERIIYDDGYDVTNATQFESFDLVGVTDPDQVWKIGRRRIAEARLRPERYTLTVDFEHLRCTRGDLVLVTHDSISTGIAAGRIAALITDIDDNVLGVTIDNPISMEFGKEYGISIRGENGNTLRQVTTVPGSNIDTLNFVEPIPAEETPFDGDLFGFGIYGEETLKCLVLNIKPTGNMNAQLTLIPYAELVFNATSGDIPDFNPNVTVDTGYTVPFVTAIRSDETVLTELPNGLFVPTVRISFGRFSSALVNRPLGVEIQYKTLTEVTYKSFFTLKQEITEIDIPDLTQGETYVIRVRYTLTRGVGPWSPEYTHTVVGMSTLPPDITGLVVEGDFLRWKYDAPPRDFRGFEMRTSTDVNAPWELMNVAHQGILKQAEFNIANYQRSSRIFAAKAIDLAGNYSANMASLARDFGDLVLDNIVETRDEDALGWPGALESGYIDAGVIYNNDTTLYLPNDSAPYLLNDSELYLPTQFEEAVYITSEFVITEDLVPGKLKIASTFTGAVLIQYRKGVDAAYLPDGGDLYLGGPDADDEEYLPAEWESEYRDFPQYVDVALHDIFRFQAILLGGENESSLSNFDIIVDVPDQTETFPALVLDVGGTRVPLTKTYRSVKIVNITLHTGSATKVEIVDKDADLGPLLQAYNGLSPSAAVGDVTVQGVPG